MLPQRLRNFAVFFHQAAEKGIILLVAAACSIIMANSKELHHFYHDFLHTQVVIAFGQSALDMSLHHWVNDFLMAIFFFQVGMEIKRELVEGHLSTAKQRILPVIAAIGGVVVPVLIYVAFNYSDSVTSRGWAIPAATDIAFALGMLALFGKGLPTSLRIFLTALAIIDDLMAVIIIALFYTDSLSFKYLLYIVLCMSLLFSMNKMRIVSIPAYLIVGLVMWYFFLQSGVHATVAGVMLGLTIPLNIKEADTNYAPLKKLERALHPLVSYLILPIFAFVNSGVDLHGMNIGTFLHPVSIGIILGLVVGKQLGVFAATYLSVVSGMAKLPENTNYMQFYGVAILCGIGFTMSLFIGNLSFEANASYLTQVKVGVLSGSLISAILGALVIRYSRYIK